MRILVSGTDYTVSASDLIRATLRLDLVPVPVSLEFTVQKTEETKKYIKERAEIYVNDIPHPLIIISAPEIDSQTIKNDRRIGAIACIAVLSGCENLMKATTNAVIQIETSFNSVIRAFGTKIKLGENLPLRKFVCLKGVLPTERIALYLQQEAAVIAFRNNKVSAMKIDALLKQDPKHRFDPSEVFWIRSDQKEKYEKASYVSIDENDGTTVIGDDTTTSGQTVIQVPGLDARQLKNLEKVLITRGVIIRNMNLEYYAGDIAEIDGKRYVFLTIAHDVSTGTSGGNISSISKIWLASL